MSPETDVFLVTGSVLELNCTLKQQSDITDCYRDQFILNKTRIMKVSNKENVLCGMTLFI